MNEKDQERLMEIISELKRLLPDFDTFMLSEDALILTSQENLEAMVSSMGYEIESVDGQELLEYLSDDDDDDEGGGLLH